MKRLLIFLTFLVASTLAVTTVRAQRIVGALKLGPAFSSFTGESDATFETRASLAGGVALGLELRGGFYFLPELLYVTKGAWFDDRIDGTPARVRFDLTYLELPLLLAYRFQTAGTVHPRLAAGPYVAYAMNRTARIEDQASDVVFNEGIEDLIETYDAGVAASVGAEVEVRAQRVLVEVRGSYGLANARTVEPAIHNAGLALLVGIMF